VDAESVVGEGGECAATGQLQFCGDAGGPPDAVEAQVGQDLLLALADVEREVAVCFGGVERHGPELVPAAHEVRCRSPGDSPRLLLPIRTSRDTPWAPTTRKMSQRPSGRGLPSAALVMSAAASMQEGLEDGFGHGDRWSSVLGA
jgi:hypothetical protein